jgi:hypothetical protein
MKVSFSLEVRSDGADEIFGCAIYQTARFSIAQESHVAANEVVPPVMESHWSLIKVGRELQNYCLRFAISTYPRNDEFLAIQFAFPELPVSRLRGVGNPRDPVAVYGPESFVQSGGLSSRPPFVFMASPRIGSVSK